MDPSQHRARRRWLPSFVELLLRSTGQTMFQDNPLTGVLFLVGIFVHSPRLGLAGVVGLLTATATAEAVHADPAVKAGGLCGLNGLFTGLALGFFLPAEPGVWLLVVVGGALAAVLTVALAAALRAWTLPPLAAPFVLTTWLLLLVVRGWPYRPWGDLRSLPLAGGPTDACRTEVLSTSHGLITASVRGIGQVLFQDSVLSGLIILLGISLNSRISALAAVLGATAGTMAVIVLGSDDPALCHGAYGYNAALAALGFGGLFFVVTWRTAIYALLCALTATAGLVWMAALLAPLGLPALSAPFTLTSWLFLLPRSRTRALAPVACADVTTPERIRRGYVTPGATDRADLD